VGYGVEALATLEVTVVAHFARAIAVGVVAVVAIVAIVVVRAGRAPNADFTSF